MDALFAVNVADAPIQIEEGFELTVTGVLGTIVKFVVATVVPHSLVTEAVTI